MPLVVGGVARYTVNQSMEAQEVANVIDVHIDTLTGDRDAHVESVARRILEAWSGSIRPDQWDELSCDSVSWVDLDSSTGTTGEVVTSGAITWPLVGGEAGAALPGGVAALVRKITTRARGQRNGRMYLGGLVEGFTEAGSPNQLTAAAIADLQPSLDSFLATVNSGEAGYDATMCVVHQDPGLQTGFFSPISALVLDPIVATQRRRQR